MTKRFAVAATVVGVLLMVATQAPAGGLRQLVDDNDVVVLRGNVHPSARPEFDLGRTAATLPMERMILALALRPEKKAALERLLSEQQDPASPNFHHWLTPEEFGARFGATPEEIAVVTGWLRSHGFAIDEVGKGGTWINFTGTVADVETAFRTQIHDYLVAGEVHHANAVDPSMPRALTSLVAGIVSLHDFLPQPAGHTVRPDTNITNGAHWLSPADFATIYNLNPLYSAGIDGTGQSVAVVGRTNIKLSDVQNFRSFSGLPANDPQFILNGADPGIVSSGEESEADLDVEWSGGVAKGATIKFVISKSTNTSGGDTLSAQYIVNNNLAPVMTMSFYLCESSMGASGNTFYNNLWAQAASQGITSFVCSGDSGAAGCDSDTASTAASGTAVSGLCSTPYDVCVGGTGFLDTMNPGAYWSGTNNPTTKASALSYIPETAWNESGAAMNCPPDVNCHQLWSTGGGASIVYPKPAWQVAPGVPAASARYVPDVSLAAAGHNAYIVFEESASPSSNFNGTSGTSAATPSLAGIMALVVQKTGQRQGNANPRFYQLGNAQYTGSGPAVFHDVTAGNNSVPGQTGFSCGAGYDLATGLGSVDATALVNNWGGGGGGGGGGTVTIFSDDFEGSFPGHWQLFVSSQSGTDSNISWGKSTYRSAGGAASIWCAGGGPEAQPPGGNYLPNEGTFAVYGPFSLGGATAASLDFDLWLNSELNYDFVYWMISVDGSNFYGASLSGSTGGWTHEKLNFSDVTQITAVGAPNVWVALIFTSDSSTEFEGAYVDNVVIQKTTPGASCSFSLSSGSQSFAGTGGTGSVGVTVTAGSNCAWTASSNASGWLHVTSGASGTGNGTVGYS
ncbi:MAG: protease pro-enzyme activation domain-containing protein, partial [Thermoanaerobaculales bacterium]